MKSQQTFTKLRASVVAVQGALAMMAAAHAQTDPTLVELTEPKSTIEIGFAGTAAGKYSAKANEYNGLRSKNPYALGSVDLRGGSRYDSDDATRWSISGSGLGTESADLGLDYGVQGSFRVRLGYDQLFRNASDTFKTPYQGVGTNHLTLPPNWQAVVVPKLGTGRDARGLSPEVTGLPTIANGAPNALTQPNRDDAKRIQDNDLPAFQNVDLFTRRSRYGLAFDQQLDTHWSLSAGVSHEHKDGLKASPVHTSFTGDAVSILPAPIDQDDDQLHLGAAYADGRFQAQLDYEGSSFKNNVSDLVWDYWHWTPPAGPAPAVHSGSSSTAPGNLFNKLSLSGAYQVADATRLVGSLAYSRGTQNDAYATDASSLATEVFVPASSAHAEVVNESASLKALHKVSKDLGLTATYKFDLRDNRTPVNTYVYNDNNSTSPAFNVFRYVADPLGVSDPTKYGTLTNFNANTPYSKRTNQIALEGDYKLGKEQHVKGGWQGQKTDRYCTGSWINCADAPHSTEHTLHGDWFGNVSESVSARFGVSTARRKVKYDENAFLAVVPMAGQLFDPTAAAVPGYPGISALEALQSLMLTGYGPVSGRLPIATVGSALAFYFPNNSALKQQYYGNHNRISELLGLRRYNQANRDRNTLHTSVDWQPSEQLSVQGGAQFADDHYRDSVYGLQRASTWAFNLDGNYAVSEGLSLGLFGSYEGQRVRTAGNTYVDNAPSASVAAVTGGCYTVNGPRVENAKVDYPCLNWATKTVDLTATIGANIELKKLAAGKLDLSGSLAYSHARTGINVTGGAYVLDPSSAAGTIVYTPASALPSNIVKSLDVHLGALYRFNSLQAMRVVYRYQRLASSDWGYQGLQPAGAPAQFLPTYEQAPNYKVTSIGLAYVLSFR